MGEFCLVRCEIIWANIGKRYWWNWYQIRSGRQVESHWTFYAAGQQRLLYGDRGGREQVENGGEWCGFEVWVSKQGLRFRPRRLERTSPHRRILLWKIMSRVKTGPVIFLVIALVLVPSYFWSRPWSRSLPISGPGLGPGPGHNYWSRHTVLSNFWGLCCTKLTGILASSHWFLVTQPLIGAAEPSSVSRESLGFLS